LFSISNNITRLFISFFGLTFRKFRTSLVPPKNQFAKIKIIQELTLPPAILFLFSPNSIPKSIMNSIFSTVRLSIYPINAIKDKRDLLLYHNNNLTMRWIPNGHKVWNENDIIKKLSINTTLYSKKLGIYKIVFNQTNQTIGEIVLFPYPDNENYVEIGYIICSLFWKSGLGTELVSGVIEYITINFQYTGIIAQLYSQNTASKKLCEKLGFNLLSEENIANNQQKLVYLKNISKL
jgi:RimJ/RimL family protein N-acetyltransferase